MRPNKALMPYMDHCTLSSSPAAANVFGHDTEGVTTGNISPIGPGHSVLLH